MRHCRVTHSGTFAGVGNTRGNYSGQPSGPVLPAAYS
jgi:hypothetical protein